MGRGLIERAPLRVRIALRTLGDAAKNLYLEHGAEWAAALAYYSLLSVFPAALLAVSLAAHFVDEQWAIEQIVAALRHLLPTVSSSVAHDVNDAIAQHGKVGIAAFAILIWTGSRVFSTLTRAVDQALGRAPRHDNFFASLVREVLLLGIAGVVLFIGTATGFLLGMLATAAPVSTQLALGAATAVARTALFGGALLLLYSYVPYPRPPFHAALRGALAATVLLVAAMPLFSTYVSKLGQYNLIYGPLAIVIVVLVWFWVASAVVLFGAHVTGVVERESARSSIIESL